MPDPTPTAADSVSPEGTAVSENSQTSGEANPMAEAPANPTDAQAQQAAEQEAKTDA